MEPAPRRILVVDDIAANRKLLRVTLEHAGYAVREAADGFRALEVLEREPIDAVISDILMPNMDGYRLCHELRSSERWRNLPFIFHSSTYRSASDEKLARDIGGDRFIAKPASAETILAALAEVIGSNPAARHAELTVQGELGLMKQYSARLVSKLEEQNSELYQRTLELEREMARREQVEQALRESEARLNFALQMSQTGGWTLDMANNTTQRTLQHDRIFGYESGLPEWNYETFLPHVLPEDRAHVDRIFGEATAGKPRWDFECRIRRVDGAVRWIWVAGEDQGRDPDQPRRMSGIVQDITERKQANAALVQAAQRMRALARRLVDAREAEQHWLSAELHDRIGQTLTAIGINLNIVTGALPPGTAGAVAERLKDSRALVEATMASVRDLISELRPAALDDYGLLAGLRWFVEQVRARAGLDMTVGGEEPAPRLAPDVEGALFRIAQEALNNTIKHAGARRVSIELRGRPGACVLGIEDDGAGFDPDQPVQPGARTHWGLEMMRERAEAVGARFRLDSAPGRGTRIEVEVERTP